MRFEDRHDAGARLATELLALTETHQLDISRTVIVALPRGGVAVGFEIARQLNTPLDICVVRKLGVPSQPELAVGAVAEGDVLVVNQDIRTSVGLTDKQLAQLANAQKMVVKERVEKFRDGTTGPKLTGKTVILVDDGLATGATALSAIQVLRRRGVARIILALPVCPADMLLRLNAEVDQLIVLQTPEFFQAVGQWYEHFDQVTDDQVQSLLQRSREFGTSQYPSRINVP